MLTSSSQVESATGLLAYGYCRPRVVLCKCPSDGSPVQGDLSSSAAESLVVGVGTGGVLSYVMGGSNLLKQVVFVRFCRRYFVVQLAELGNGLAVEVGKFDIDVLSKW